MCDLAGDQKNKCGCGGDKQTEAYKYLEMEAEEISLARRFDLNDEEVKQVVARTTRIDEVYRVTRRIIDAADEDGIMHSPEADAAIDEFERVVKPAMSAQAILMIAEG